MDKPHVMNFAFYSEKEGTKRALDPAAGDAVALLEVLGILGKGWQNVHKLFVEDTRRVDALYKVYYPIFLIKSSGAVVPVDGLGLSRMRACEYLRSGRRYCLLETKSFEFPIIDQSISRLFDWFVATSEAEIDDGFAMPPLLDEAGAKEAADEFSRIYRYTKGEIERVRSEMEAQDIGFIEESGRIAEERKKLETNYAEKIAGKNQEIESLLEDAEVKVLREIKDDLKKSADALLAESREIVKGLNDAKEELRRTMAESDEWKRRLDEVDGEIGARRAKIRELMARKEREEAEGKVDALRETIKEVDEDRKRLKELDLQSSAYAEKAEAAKARQAELCKKIDELQASLQSNLERRRILPSKGDLVDRKIAECFAKRRENLIKDLNQLLLEKERVLLEAESKEKQLLNDHREKKERLKQMLEMLEDEIKRLEGLVLEGEGLPSSDVALVYVPFYLVSIDKKLGAIEPPLVIGKGGRIQHHEKSMMEGIVDLIERDWKTLSLLLYEAKETFDVLDGRNRERILKGIEALRGMGLISRVEEAVLIRKCFSRR